MDSNMTPLLADDVDKDSPQNSKHTYDELIGKMYGRY